MTSADVRLLASMCENLGVVRVAQVDSRDALVLYRRAAQTVLEEGSARAGGREKPIMDLPSLAGSHTAQNCYRVIRFRLFLQLYPHRVSK